MKPLLFLLALISLGASGLGQTVLHKGDVFDLRIGGVLADVAADGPTNTPSPIMAR